MMTDQQLHSPINPYVKKIHDHPAYLLPEPKPELLEEKRKLRPLGSGRLIVDLGCGSGTFLMKLGMKSPGDHLIGFELRYKRLVKSAIKLEKNGLDNVWLLREAAENFDRYFRPNSIDMIFINFPDPWPKPSQWKKRLISPGFVKTLEKSLKDSGTLHVKTDHSGYFLHTISLFKNQTGWRIRGIDNDLHRCGPRGPDVSTEFEQLFAGKGKPIFYLLAEKSVLNG